MRSAPRPSPPCPPPCKRGAHVAGASGTAATRRLPRKPQCRARRRYRAFKVHCHSSILTARYYGTAGKLISTGCHRFHNKSQHHCALLCALRLRERSAARAWPIGEAFVGPAILKIRSDIPLQSSTVATVKHGDRLEILQTRRRFLRVRTPNGAEGWTDERQLLAASDMDALKELIAHAAKLPSQGVATTYAPLNIHTQPVLSSPSYLQLKENEKFDVLQSVVLRALRGSAQVADSAGPKKPKALPKKEKKAPKVPPPPMPKPPPLPADWLELSKTERDEADAPSKRPPQKLAPKVDGWSLIRTPTGQAGWVLTRLVSMAIPDEVAQYAEGKRIVSYFPLGEVDGRWARRSTSGCGPPPATAGSPGISTAFASSPGACAATATRPATSSATSSGYSPVLVKDVELGSKTGAAQVSGLFRLRGKEGRRSACAASMRCSASPYGSPASTPANRAPPPPTLQNPSPLPVAEAAARPHRSRASVSA